MNNTKTVLVIEDEKLLSKAISIQLQNTGFNVLNAFDGKEGLSVLEKNTPDAILLDIVMPVMDGFEFLTTIKKDEKYKNIPIMILSNLGQDEEIEKGKSLGANEFFIKADNDLSSITQKVSELAGKA